MAADFSSHPQDLIAAIGPSIGACCYTVGDEVHTAFTSAFEYSEALFRKSSASALHLDLWEANRRQLLASGLSASSITVVGDCTGCTGLPNSLRYFSHRRDEGFTGRMMNVIGIASAPAWGSTAPADDDEAPAPPSLPG